MGRHIAMAIWILITINSLYILYSYAQDDSTIPKVIRNIAKWPLPPSGIAGIPFIVFVIYIVKSFIGIILLCVYILFQISGPIVIYQGPSNWD